MVSLCSCGHADSEHLGRSCTRCDCGGFASVNFHANVVAINLAKCLFYARCERYSLPSVMFDALPPDLKQDWIEKADRILDDMKPAGVVDFAAHLKDFAVDTARTQFGGTDAVNRAR